MSSWDDRIKWVVTNFYDTDNNGYLDQLDFENLALRNTILETRGEYKKEAHEANRKVMGNLWKQFAELADFDKDGQVSVDEFREAVRKVCMGKPFGQFPESLRHSITQKFKAIDCNGDDLMSIEEYRVDVVNRTGSATIEEIDGCWNKLVNDEDRKRGGVNLARYQELWAEFIGNAAANVPGANLFGPLPK
jgi:Ca2+-binding EF-hand superfamily protein